MPIGLITLHLHIPECYSLKEKRSRIKPLLNSLHRKFNISAAEVDRLDDWHETVISCVIVSNDSTYCMQVLQQISRFINNNYPDLLIIDDQIEII